MSKQDMIAQDLAEKIHHGLYCPRGLSAKRASAYRPVRNFA